MQDLCEYRVSERFIQVDGKAVSVIWSQAQADPNTINFNAVTAVKFFYRILQVVIEVKLVVGKIGRAVHRTAVGNDKQDAPCRVALHHSSAGPLDGLTVEAFAKVRGLQ